MSKENKFIDAKRRGFLQGTAVATGALATGAASAVALPEEDQAIQAEAVGNDGYRLTENVKRYYKKARF